MKKQQFSKRKIAILCLAVLDIAIGCLFFANRAFPRLVLWPIRESADRRDFIWEPGHQPDYFHFEQLSNALLPLKSEIENIIRDKDDDTAKALSVARYVHSLARTFRSYNKRLVWGEPRKILLQIKDGAIGNCFHYSIIYSTYLSSIGIPSRLWTLEGDDGFGPLTHTVCEVYLAQDKQWVIVDAFWGVYFMRNNRPLSLLELRDALLTKSYSGITVESVNGEPLDRESILRAYSRLMPDIFLRAGGDFVARYKSGKRYGILSPFAASLDRLPSEWRRGMSYLTGRRDALLHYVDNFSTRFGLIRIAAIALFYFFVLSFPLLIYLLWRSLAEARTVNTALKQIDAKKITEGIAKPVKE